MFITGITRYKDDSLLTAGNTITDISQDNIYGTITGFTYAELKKYFYDNLIAAASLLKNKSQEQVTSTDIEELLSELAHWYDGYSFDRNTDTHVFSTISIINFFSNEDPKSMFKNYWYDLGGIPSILIKNVAKLLNSDVINSFNQDIEFKVFKNSFANPTSIETMDEKVMLFQTGYLTLAKPIETNIISLKIPNQELRASFEQLQFLIWFENNQKVIESKLKDNIFNLNYDSDIKQIIEYFTLILNALPYGKDVYKNEYNVITPIFTFLLGSGFKVFTETHTLKGRTDLRIDFDNNRSMIFEFKFNSIKSKQTADDKLQEAIKQITDKAYAKLPNKEVKSYAIVFDEKQKSFVAYKEV